MSYKFSNQKNVLHITLLTVSPWTFNKYYIKSFFFYFLCHLKRRHIGITSVGGGGDGVRISLSGA